MVEAFSVTVIPMGLMAQLLLSGLQPTPACLRARQRLASPRFDGLGMVRRTTVAREYALGLWAGVVGV